jgi:hypothetical protein
MESIGVDQPRPSSGEGYSPHQGYDPSMGDATMQPGPMRSGSFTGGPVGGQPSGPPPLEGSYVIPDIYVTLYNTMVEMGLKPLYALGVIRQFRHFKPEDYDQLDNILRGGGTSVQARDQILRAWRLETTPSEQSKGGAAETTGSAESALKTLKEELGMAPSSKTKLEALLEEKNQLELEEIQLRIQERRKNLGLTEEEPEEEDPMTTILLDINGVPVEKKVRQSKIPQYAPYMKKVDSGAPPAPTISPEVAELRAKLAAETAHREAMEKQQAEDRWRRLEEQLAELKSGGAGGGANDKISKLEDAITRMREDSAKREADSYRAQLESTRAELQRVSSPSYIEERDRMLLAEARKKGMIPAAEAAQLQEAQIGLKEKLNAATRKDEAQGKAIDVAANRMADKPVSALLDKTGLVPLVGELVKKNIREPGSEEAGAKPPAPEEVARLAGILEAEERAHGTAEPPPSLETPAQPRISTPIRPGVDVR